MSRIRKKLNYFVIISSLLLSLSVIFIFFVLGANFLVNNTQKAFQMETNFTLREIDRLIFERSTDLEVLARTLNGLVENQNFTRLEDVFFTLRDRTKVYQNIAYVDENMIKRVDTNRIAIGKEVAWPILKKAEDEKKVIFEFFEEPETRTQIISFVKRVTGTDGKSKGYIVCNVPFSSITRVTRLSRKEDHFKNKSRIEILNENGEILYSNYRQDKVDLELARQIETPITTGNFKFMKAGNRLWSFGTGQSFHSVERLKWFLVISADELDVYGPLKSSLLVLSFLLLAVFSIFGLIISEISKSMVRPFEGASLAIEKFGQGELNALESLEIPQDDLGVLLQNLKSMGRQIRDLIAERTQKARAAILGEMAGNIAHEINNPLQVISIRLELIQKEIRKGVDISRVENNISVATQTVFRISKIIKGLKALSREGDADPFAPVSLQELADNVLVLCQGTVRNSMVDIDFTSDQPEFTIECRAVQITQVLLNLINNSLDAVNEQDEKWIQVRAEVVGSEVIFKVRNSGPRISREVVQRIFDPFYTTKRTGQGTGLGLSISLKIAKEHAGSLFVDLEDVQTCFVFKISTQASLQASFH